jgi:hypothetical protein
MVRFTYRHVRTRGGAYWLIQEPTDDPHTFSERPASPAEEFLITEVEMLKDQIPGKRWWNAAGFSPASFCLYTIGIATWSILIGDFVFSFFR